MKCSPLDNGPTIFEPEKTLKTSEINAKKVVSPQICPLCQKENACMNIYQNSNKTTCWCANPEINFSQSLLDKLPSSARGLACICQSCALKYQNR